MSIYTKKGDFGKTKLFDNTEVYKDDIRVESYGSVDELISYIGLTKHYIESPATYNHLESIQNKLFIITSKLASGSSNDNNHQISEEDVEYLENIIDAYLGLVPNLNKFIVPGSSIAAANLHVARTLCRKAERKIVTLAKIEEIDPFIIKYINRLSDTLFALARYYEENETIVTY